MKQTLKLGKHSIAVSNADKVLYPAAGFTKLAVVAYYVGVSRFILPHLKNRPVALKRYPEGIHGESFWEKDAPSFAPKWVTTTPVARRDSAEPPINYILINDRRTLAWVASIASLEIHPFLHRVPMLDTPTAIVFDLDPGEGTDLLACAQVAVVLKDVLERMQLESFPKVSGSKGIQVYVPLNSPITYGITQPFARTVARLLEQEHPDLVTAEMARNLRKGKVFIDWSQNAAHKTTVAAYSLRAKRHRPHVSMPVTWQEIAQALDRKKPDELDFSPAAAIERLGAVGDLFAPVLSLKQQLPETFVTGVRTVQKRPLRPKSLEAYAEKRRFDKTPEPAPTMPRRSRQGGRRRFVIQKHSASHLHYDLRLESQEVLRSWSVPKGMPYALNERRLAIQTEDHPLDYLTFEGIIPKGQYGGGTVMVWDIGTCEVIEGNYWKGRLHFFLRGSKLEGEWLLERDPARGEKAWALTKAGSPMRPVPSKAADRSALTGRTTAEIAEAKDAEWHSNRARKEGGSQRAIKQRTKPKITGVDLAAQPAARLVFVEPMQCKLVANLPEGPEWQYEIKFDGYRAFALKTDAGARLLSRRGNDLALRFPRVASAVETLPDNTMIDGEVVALGDDGRPSFKLLQRAKTLQQRIFYYAFDILAYAGRDISRLSLRERRQVLEQALADAGDPIRHSAPIESSGDRLIAAAREQGFEGVIGKRADSVYEPGRRSGAWVKCRVSPGQELVVGGYLPAHNTFDALLVGYYEGRRLIFIAKIRNGFVPAVKREILERMRGLETGVCPFANLPEPKNARRGIALTAEVMKRCRWLKPKLVAQIEFTEWTDKNHLRHSRFLGLRDDKDPREVTRESIAA